MKYFFQRESVDYTLSLVLPIDDKLLYEKLNFDLKTGLIESIEFGVAATPQKMKMEFKFRQMVIDYAKGGAIKFPAIGDAKSVILGTHQELKP